MFKIELFWHLNCVLMLNWIIWNKTVLTLTLYCSVGWGCRIHWLHLCRGVRPHHPSTKKCPGYNTKQSDGEVPMMLGLWAMQSTPFIATASRTTLAQNGRTWLGPIYGLNRTKLHTFLNWIVWIRTVWINWIAWNRNVFDN